MVKMMLVVGERTLILKCFGSFSGSGTYHMVSSTVKMMLMKE